MASRYLPQQQLIGPALFPYYRQALKIVVFWVVLPIALFGGAISAIYSDDPTAGLGRVLGAAWNGAIYAVGIVTIVFAILEHERVRITALDNWNPAKLPEPQPAARCRDRETVLGLVFASDVPAVVDGPAARARVHQLRRRPGAIRGRADLERRCISRSSSSLVAERSASTWSIWCARGARITVSMRRPARSTCSTSIIVAHAAARRALSSMMLWLAARTSGAARHQRAGDQASRRVRRTRK